MTRAAAPALPPGTLPAAALVAPPRRRRRALFALVALAAASVGVAVLALDTITTRDVPRLAEASVSPDGRLIAFTAGSGDDLDLFVVDAAGRRPPRRVAGGDGFEQAPIWSPDGTRLLLTRTDEFQEFAPAGELWLVEVDGTGARRLTRAESSDAAWSPDGRRVAVVVSRPEDEPSSLGGQLTVVAVDGSGPRELVSGRRALHPRWAPDGSRIAFWSGRPARENELLDHGDLYVVAARGGPATRLTSTANVNTYSSAWAPDGTRLAYVRDPDLTRSVLETLELATRRVRRLPGVDVSLGWPSWSPDGRDIAVEASGVPEVWSDGSRRRVLDGQSVGGPLRWSPDGRRVAHDTTHGLFEPIPADVVVASLDDSATVNVTHTPKRDDTLVGWLADSRRLAVVRDERELWIVDLRGRGRRLVAAPGDLDR